MTGRKLTALDGLRGLAAFIVVIHHFACAFFPALIFGDPNVAHSRYELWVYKSPLDLVVAGNFAVCIFFVISGFVLTHKYFSTGNAEVIRSGAVRRYFRLMPPVLAAVLIAYALNKLGLFYNLRTWHITNSAWFAISWADPAHLLGALKTGLYSAFITSNNINEYDNVLWTMKLEFLGSFLVFGTALLFGKIRNRWIAYGVLCLLYWRTYYLAFLIGLILADISAQREFRLPRFQRTAGWFSLGVALILGSLAVPGAAMPPLSRLLNETMQRDQAFIFYHIVGAALLVISILWLRPLRNWFDRKPLQYLGRISFSLYLLHQLVLGSFGAYVFLHFYRHLSYNDTVIVSFLLSLPIIFVAADRLTAYVDRTAILWSGALYRNLFSPSGMEPPTGAVTEPSPESLGNEPLVLSSSLIVAMLRASSVQRS